MEDLSVIRVKLKSFMASCICMFNNDVETWTLFIGIHTPLKTTCGNEESYPVRNYPYKSNQIVSER